MKRRKTEHKPKGYWENIENRKKYFLNFAAEAGFDPLLQRNWDSVTASQICTKKV